MAKIVQPFNALAAVGTFGGLLTATQRRGRQYIQFAKPARSLGASVKAGYGNNVYGISFFGFFGRVILATQSARQGVQKNLFLQAWSAWRALSPTEKMVLLEQAERQNITAANLFLSRYMIANRP